MLLSDRMRALVGLVKPCHCMADIGCDHGYVAMELILSHICEKVIATDINHGPLQLATSNIKDYEMQEFIDTRLSDGTQALMPNEADGIVCAGMGGKLIIQILQQGMELVQNMRQLILQPQSDIQEVRSFLRESGFIIEKEDMVYEDEKYYPMMRVIPQAFGKQEKQMADNLAEKPKKHDTKEPPVISEISSEEAEKIIRIEDIYGPYLLQNSHPVLKKYLLWQKENYENILVNLVSQKKSTARQQYRILELDRELSDIVFCLYNYYAF